MPLDTPNSPNRCFRDQPLRKSERELNDAPKLPESIPNTKSSSAARTAWISATLYCCQCFFLNETTPSELYLQNEYQHILVDEYQDVNRSSVRLLMALCPDGRNLWAVGDAKQSIYRFRGASPFNMVRFGKVDFPAGERGRLELNYRSVEEVVEVFSTFALSMQAGGRTSGLKVDPREIWPPTGVPNCRARRHPTRRTCRQYRSLAAGRPPLRRSGRPLHRQREGCLHLATI